MFSTGCSSSKNTTTKTELKVDSDTKSSSQSAQVQSKEQSTTQPVKGEEQKNTETRAVSNLSQPSNTEESKVANVSTVVTKTSTSKSYSSSTGVNSLSNSETVATDKKVSDSNNAEVNTSEALIIPLAPVEQTLTGYIEDVHCFFAYEDPAKDTKGCLSMLSCAKSGYGITVPQSDGTKKFYFFDGKFPTFADGKTFDGTDSQLAAWNLIKNITKKDNVTIKVTGILEETEKTYVNGSGVVYSFPVLKVTSLGETSILNSIAITTPASKLVYSVGDTLDIIGLQVTGNYDDNTKVLQSVTAANVTGFDSSKPVEGRILTITVGGKTTAYAISVKQAPDKIEITKSADKLIYTVKDKLDITGLVVTATYSDGTKVVLPITTANISGFNSSSPAVNQALEIKAGGKVATYIININPQIQTYTGYIIDEDCFISYDNPGDDTKMCLSMKSCAASGYGIAVPQNDGTFKLYYFDGSFATYENKVFTEGTGTQLKAYNLIKATSKNDHVEVIVMGTLGEETKVSAEGKSYNIIKVTSLAEK
jgi:hypothetical protein